MIREAPSASAPKRPWLPFSLGCRVAACLLLAGCERTATPDGVASSAAYQAYLEATGKGDPAEALAQAEALRESFPESAVAWNCVGEALAKTGALDESVAALRRALEIDPGLARAWADLGVTLNMQGATGEARTAFEKATEVDPEYWIGWHNLVNSLSTEGKTDEVLAVFHRAVKANPVRVEVWSSLGGALMRLNRMEEAIHALRKVTEIDPEQGLAWADLGGMLAVRGELAESIAASERALALDPTNRETVSNLMVVHKRAGNLEESAIHLARLVLMGAEMAQRGDDSLVTLLVSQSIKEAKLDLPMEAPTDGAIQAYYERHRETLGDSAIHLRTITVPKRGNTRELVEGIRANVAAGQDFAAIARAHSSDSAASEGGDRGWLKRGDLRPDLEEAAFALPAGQFSGVIEDATDFRILNVVERREGTAPSLDDAVRGRIAEALKDEALNRRIAGWIAEARRRMSGPGAK